MIKRIVFAIALLVAILAAASYFSPHATVSQMRNAIEKRDYDTFSHYVDYPALRESFRGQMAAALQEMAQDDPDHSGALGALTRGIVTSLVAPMLDVMITPAGVIEMMNRGTPKITSAVVVGAITQTPAAPESVPEMMVSYQGWDRVAFYRTDTSENDGRFILRRHGLWSWRLAAVEL